MAVISFRVNHLTVSPTRAASRVVQYLTREGRYAPDQAQVAYLTRTSVATAERGDLVHQEAANLPSWAHGDAAGFFARAEQHERANGRWGTTWQLALPKELARDAQLTLARDFLATHLVDKPYLWVMHDPVNAAGEHQPHIHVLFSERTHDGIERRGPAHYFKQWDRHTPARGGCGKDRWFNHRSSVYEIRAAWCDATNYTMERAGEAARIHPDSLYTRGIDRQPEPKVGPRQDPVARAARERITRTRDAAKEQAQAAAAWEARKTRLGITDVQQLAPQDFFQASYARARGTQLGQWAPGTPSAQAQQQAQTARIQAQRQGQVRTLAAEVRILTRRQERLEPPAITEAQTWKRLTQPLIGNVTSQIYHAPGDPNYGEVVPPHQILFWSHGEAEAAGYRQAVNQHYGEGADTPMADRRRQARERRARQHAQRQIARALRGSEQEQDPIRSGLRARLHDEEWHHGRRMG